MVPTQHVLIRMVEEWRINLENDYIVGAILMDLQQHLILSHMIYSKPNYMLTAWMKTL